MALIYQCSLVLLSIVFLLLCKCSAQKTENISIICDTGATCATCFRELVNSAITPEKNQLNMQKAFFPPESANPVYVVVHYSFIGREEVETWYWSMSQYYASFHPLPVYQFTSLFFGDFKFRTKELNLTLGKSCFGASIDNMMLLTQRLKLYAMKRSIYPGIDDTYEPKAESAATIKKYHTRTDIRASVLLLFGQVFIFPIVGIFISFLIHYYIKLYKLQDTCTLKGDAPPGNVTGNDPPGNVTGNDPPGNVAGNDPPGNVAGNDPPGNVAGEDGIIQQQQQQQQQQQHQKKNTKAGVRTFSFSGTFENGILGGYITEHQNEAKILQEEKQKEDDIKAKLSVIVTLSYMFSLYSVIMSMLAVIYANNPNLQGLSEFEWYEQLEALRAIPIIIFVEDVIIFNSLHFYTTCLMIIYIIKLYIGERESKCNNWLRKYIIPTTVWKYSAYCAIAPGFNLAIHGFDIIIALIHNEVHATSVGAAYVALLLINVYTLRALYKSDLEIKFLTNIVNCLCCCCNAVAMLCCCFKHRIFPFRVFFFFLVSLFITGICGFIVAVYIILPINSAFDKASSSLRIIYSVAIFVFTAFVTYWLLKKK